MKSNWSPLVLTRVSLAALVAALLLACGGESAGPSTPPPPPPFQPQTVVVQLGSKGGATTLISTQAGGWTRNGQPFTSGSEVTGENAAKYKLTLANGTWTAEFVPPEPVPLALGISGDAVSLQAQEDGSFQLDGKALTSGTVVDAKNGNQYKLVLGSDGDWMAEFVPPAPQGVTLGTSGESRQIGRLEDGSFTLDGQPLATGTEVTAQNQNKYTLTLGSDGTWSAAYVQPPPQQVQLGTTGDVPLLVYRQENGTYRLNDEPLLGGRVVEASNGQSYRLSLRTDGRWQAVYQPSSVSVRLGTFGGSVNLTRNEDGTWMRGSTTFSSGDTITGSNGFEYRLTLGNDGWIVEPLPATINVTVIGVDATLELARYEDGSYRHNNERVASGDEIEAGGNTYRLQFANRRWTATFLQGEVVVSLGSSSDSITLIKKPNGTYEFNGTRVRNGSLVRSPNTGIRYRLSLSNGVWTTSVYVPPTTDPGDGGGGTDPVVAAENIMDALPTSYLTDQGAFDTSANAIQANVADRTDSNGVKVDYSPYRGSGKYEDDTFVESALRAIDKILVPIKNRGLADGDDAQQFVARVLVDSHWSEVDSALDAIFSTKDIVFGSKPPKRLGETDLDEALDDLEDLKHNLSDAASFKSAYKTQIAAIPDNSAVTGDEVFTARKRVLALGSSNNTRFGVISTLINNATAETVAQGGTYIQKAFTFSPLAATKTASLPSRGTARYTGRTWAISPDSVLYTGSIELLASIGIEMVKTTVSNLRRSDNNASWAYQGKEIDKIELPEIDNEDFDDTNGSFGEDSGDAKLMQDDFGGLFSTTVPSSQLKGQFVGTGTGQSAGTAVIGTWRVGSVDNPLLDGSFGAERSTINSVTLPLSSSAVGFTRLLDSTTIDTSTDPNNPTLGVPVPSSNAITFKLSALGIGNNTKTETDKKAIVRLGKTSLTRFGVWKLEVTSGGDTTVTNGLFAYSQLAQTSFDANHYPRRVEATYSGRTVAIDNSNNYYDASYVLRVDWNASSRSDSTIQAVISGLSRRLEFNGVGVSRIGFEDAFQGTSFDDPTKTTVEYQTGTTDDTVSGGVHNGFFVGGDKGTDGPFGVIGDWSVGVGNTTIGGVFGADLVRSP